MGREYTKELLVTAIICACIHRARTVEEITRKIYDNGSAKSKIRIFECLEIMIENDLVVPKLQQKKLVFQVKKEKLLGKD